MIFHTPPSDPWEQFDFKLLEAYQILQDETCPHCGNPVWVCRSTNPRIRFKMQKSVCFAERYEEEWKNRKNRRMGKGETWSPGPGEQWFPVLDLPEGEPMPTRMDYIKELNDLVK